MCFFANVSAHLFASHSLDHILPIVFSKHEFPRSIWKCSLYAKGTKLLSCKFGIFFGLFLSTEFPQYFQAVTIPVGTHRVYIFVIINKQKKGRMSVSRFGTPAIGLPNDPSEEIPDISSTFGEHAYGDHVEHLYCLVQSHVELAQV